MSPSTIAFHTEFSELCSAANLKPLWRDLERRAETHFFLSWHWIGSWLAELDTAPWLLTVRQNKLTVGLLLINRRDLRWRRVLSRRQAWLNTAGDEAADVVTIEYNDILVDHRHSNAVRRVALGELCKHFDSLVWQGAESDREPFLIRPGWQCRRLAEAGSAFVNLVQIRANKQPYLMYLSANTRQQIRRSMRLYEKRGPLRLERARTIDEALSFFHDAGKLHQHRWTARGKPGAFAFPFYVAMHERVIASAYPEGAVELIRVCVGSSAIGLSLQFCLSWPCEFLFWGHALRFRQALKARFGHTHVMY